MPTKVTRAAMGAGAGAGYHHTGGGGHGGHRRGPRFRGGWVEDVDVCVDEYGREVPCDVRELVTIGELPTTFRGGATSARLRARANPPHPFDSMWPDYTREDRRVYRAAARRDAAPWTKRANAAYGLVPRRTMGNIGLWNPLDLFDGILAASTWGTVALTGIAAGVAGFGLGLMVGSSEAAKAIGRHVSAAAGTVTQHAATHVGKHVIPALMSGAE